MILVAYYLKQSANQTAVFSETLAFSRLPASRVPGVHGCLLSLHAGEAGRIHVQNESVRSKSPFKKRPLTASTRHGVSPGFQPLPLLPNIRQPSVGQAFNSIAKSRARTWIGHDSQTPPEFSLAHPLGLPWGNRRAPGIASTWLGGDWLRGLQSPGLSSALPSSVAGKQFTSNCDCALRP
jgi:hypothetical protein